MEQTAVGRMPSGARRAETMESGVSANNVHESSTGSVYRTTVLDFQTHQPYQKPYFENAARDDIISIPPTIEEITEKYGKNKSFRGTENFVMGYLKVDSSVWNRWMYADFHINPAFELNLDSPPWEPVGADIDATLANGSRPLHVGAALFSTDYVKSLLDRGADLEARDHNAKWAALHFAASKGRSENIKLLLERGSQLESKTFLKETPLAIAVQGNHKDAAWLLLQNGANMEALSTFRYSPLFFAVRDGYDDMVELLLECGANPNVKTITEDTPLHNSADRGRTESMELLLQHGADVNAHNDEGLTPLYNSIRLDHLETTQVLLANGADVNAKCSRGYTPLQEAAMLDRFKLAKLLLDAGAEVGTTCPGGHTPLVRAIERGYIRTVKVLLENGANCLEESLTEYAYRAIPLTIAVRKGFDEIVRLLLKQGEAKTQVSAVDKYGETALHDAVRLGSPIIVGLLLDHGADLEAKGGYLDHTPLQLAIINHHDRLVELLLECGANTNVRDIRGDTSLHIAIDSGELKIAELLLKAGADIQIRNRKLIRPFAFLSKRNQATKDLYKKFKNGLVNTGSIS